MIEAEIIELNMWKTIKTLSTAEPEIVAYKPSELTFIRGELEYTKPHLWLCALFVHYGFIRPAELVRLKIGSLNFENKTISLPGSKTKNKNSNVILMPEPLYKKLIEMDYHTKPKNLLIVSNGRKLTPGDKEIAPTRIAEEWKEFVMDKYKIDKGIYIMKHTGAGLLFDNGADPRSTQMQLRHESLDQTLVYLKKYSNKPNETLRQHFHEI